jgi:hypothetical protein
MNLDLSLDLHAHIYMSNFLTSYTLIIIDGIVIWTCFGLFVSEHHVRASRPVHVRASVCRVPLLHGLA